MDIRQQDVYNRIMKVTKRIALTIVCCIPVLVLFGFFTRKVITSDALLIFIFVTFMGIVVLIEEIIYRKRQKKKEQSKKDNTDVFR